MSIKIISISDLTLSVYEGNSIQWHFLWYSYLKKDRLDCSSLKAYLESGTILLRFIDHTLITMWVIYWLCWKWGVVRCLWVGNVTFQRRNNDIILLISLSAMRKGGLDGSQKQKPKSGTAGNFSMSSSETIKSKLSWFTLLPMRI